MQRGLTLVEILAVLVILMLVLGALYTTFSVQRKAKARESVLIESQETGQLILNILSRDIMMAGYGVYKKLALYIEDGGNDAPDRLYINDWTFLDDNELLHGTWGQTEITGGAGGSSITLDKLDIDGDGRNEFIGEASQYVISDTTDYNQKVAKIKNINSDTQKLTLQGNLAGREVAPAIFYEIDNGILKKSARDTGGRQPLANNVVDLQIAYRDRDGNWYCANTTTPCPMNPFDPEKIALVRISIVMRTGKKTEFSRDPWPLENRRTGPYDPDYSYRVYTVEIAPRNLIYNR